MKMKLEKSLASLVILSMMILVLSGCGGATRQTGAVDRDLLASDPLAAIRLAQQRFPDAVVNNGEHIGGNTLRIAVASSTTFSGLIDRLFTSRTIDTDVAWFMKGTGLFASDPDNDIRIGRGGMASIDEWCHDTQSILIRLNYEVFWHDGVQLTLDDLVFVYETISHPDYTGVRWTAMVWNVVGTHAFRNGEADHISGLVLSDCRMELRMYFYEWSPSLQYFGFWNALSPRHHLEHIPVAELAQHPNVRHNALGWGPFIPVSHVPGESWLFRANDNYWQGRPYVDYLTFQIIPPASAPMHAEAGTFDIIRGFPTSQVEHFPNPTNFMYVGLLNRAGVAYIGFSMGYFDSTYSIVRPDENALSIYIRRAMARAIPWQDISNYLFSGLLVPAGNIMAMMHRDLHDPSLNFNRYNPAEANRILDAAGYTQRCPQGFRRNPDGSELVIRMLFNNPATAAAETSIQMQLQSFRDIGLDVRLYQDRTWDQNVALSMLNSTDAPFNFDMFAGSWSVSTNPSPNNLWGPYSRLNRPRYTSPTFYEIINTIQTDPRMWDPDFALEVYHRWQRAFYDEVPAFPTTWSLGIRAVNNRVAYFNTRLPSNPRHPSHLQYHLVRLTAATPYSAR